MSKYATSRGWSVTSVSVGLSMTVADWGIDPAWGRRAEEWAGSVVERIDEAIGLAKSGATSKFDETIEVALNLGVDPRHADQMVRGVCQLPHGSGRKLKRKIGQSERTKRMYTATKASSPAQPSARIFSRTGSTPR